MNNSRNLFLITLVIISIFVSIKCQCIQKESQKNTVQEVSLKEAIQNYLQNNIAFPEYGGKIFASYELFGYEVKNDRIFCYLWTHYGEYYLENGELMMGSASSVACVLIAIPTDSGYVIIQHKEPRDGDLYSKSIREMFPQKYHQRIFADSDEYNRRADTLEKQAIRQAKIFYNL